MTHNDHKQRALLSLYGELSEADQQILDEHLRGCGECRAELEQLRKLHASLGQSKRLEPSNELLNEARRQFQKTLQSERSSPGALSAFLDLLAQFELPSFKVVFGGVFILAIGMVLGYFAFTPSFQWERSLMRSAVQGGGGEDGTRITNLRFTDADAGDGEIEFTFDAVRTVRMKGSINDDDIRKVMAYALLNEQNPGMRIRTVSALAPQTEEQQPTAKPDKDVRESLIKILTTDSNPGVRKEALTALQKFPLDDEIRDVLLYVLKHDQNSGIRVAAINSLGKIKAQKSLLDDESLRILRDATQRDANNYVRILAKNVLEEIKQQ